MCALGVVLGCGHERERRARCRGWPPRRGPQPWSARRETRWAARSSLGTARRYRPRWQGSDHEASRVGELGSGLGGGAGVCGQVGVRATGRVDKWRWKGTGIDERGGQVLMKRNLLCPPPPPFGSALDTVFCSAGTSLCDASSMLSACETC